MTFRVPFQITRAIIINYRNSHSPERVITRGLHSTFRLTDEDSSSFRRNPTVEVDRRILGSCRTSFTVPNAEESDKVFSSPKTREPSQCGNKKSCGQLTKNMKTEDIHPVQIVSERSPTRPDVYNGMTFGSIKQVPQTLSRKYSTIATVNFSDEDLLSLRTLRTAPTRVENQEHRNITVPSKGPIYVQKRFCQKWQDDDNTRNRATMRKKFGCKEDPIVEKELVFRQTTKEECEECIPTITGEGTPTLKRLVPKFDTNKLKWKHENCNPDDMCAPRMDEIAGYKVVGKRLKKFPTIVDCQKCDRIYKDCPPLKRLAKTYDTSKMKYVYPGPCEQKIICTPRMDEVKKYKVVAKKLQKLPIIADCNKCIPYSPKNAPDLGRPRKRDIPEAPRECPVPDDICAPRMDDIKGYKVKGKKLKPLPVICDCEECIPFPVSDPTPKLKPLKKAYDPSQMKYAYPDQCENENDCAPRMDDVKGFTVQSKPLKKIPAICDCEQCEPVQYKPGAPIKRLSKRYDPSKMPPAYTDCPPDDDCNIEPPRLDDVVCWTPKKKRLPSFNGNSVRKFSTCTSSRTCSKVVTRVLCNNPEQNNVLFLFTKNPNNFVGQRAFSLGNPVAAKKNGKCAFQKKKSSSKCHLPRFHLPTCGPATNICKHMFHPECQKVETPYVAFSDCYDEFYVKEPNECPDMVNYLLQPKNQIAPDIHVQKPPPPEWNHVDPLLERKCLACNVPYNQHDPIPPNVIDTCPKYNAAGCQPRARKSCLEFFIPPKCKKVEAPYPSFSDQRPIFAEIELSECQIAEKNARQFRVEFDAKKGKEFKFGKEVCPRPLPPPRSDRCVISVGVTIPTGCAGGGSSSGCGSSSGGCPPKLLPAKAASKTKIGNSAKKLPGTNMFSIRHHSISSRCSAAKSSRPVCGKLKTKSVVMPSEKSRKPFTNSLCSLKAKKKLKKTASTGSRKLKKSASSCIASDPKPKPRVRVTCPGAKLKSKSSTSCFCRKTASSKAKPAISCTALAPVKKASSKACFSVKRAKKKSSKSCLVAKPAKKISSKSCASVNPSKKKSGPCIMPVKKSSSKSCKPAKKSSKSCTKKSSSKSCTKKSSSKSCTKKSSSKSCTKKSSITCTKKASGPCLPKKKKSASSTKSLKPVPFKKIPFICPEIKKAEPIRLPSKSPSTNKSVLNECEKRVCVMKKPSIWDKVCTYFKARPNCPTVEELRQQRLKLKAVEAARAAGLEVYDPKLEPTKDSDWPDPCGVGPKCQCSKACACTKKTSCCGSKKYSTFTGERRAYSTNPVFSKEQVIKYCERIPRDNINKPLPAVPGSSTGPQMAHLKYISNSSGYVGKVYEVKLSKIGIRNALIPRNVNEEPHTVCQICKFVPRHRVLHQLSQVSLKQPLNKKNSSSEDIKIKNL